MNRRRSASGPLRGGNARPRVAGFALLWLMLGLGACANGGAYQGTYIDPPLEMPVIRGMDGRDRPFDSADLQGKVQVVFFGYTFCPDFCPTVMYEITEAYTDLARQRDQIEVLFVSVDPQRDTSARLRTYVDLFHGDFRGIRIADPDSLDEVAAGYGLFLESHRQHDDDTEYLVDHTVRTYVLDRGGRMALTYGSDLSAQDLARDLRRLLRQ